MVIVDTSVAYKWTDQAEINANLANELLAAHLTSLEEIVVPDLLLFELVNIWSTKSNISLSQAKENWDFFKQCNIQISPINFDLIETILEVAKEYKITSYDAAYVSLAQQKKCILITADEKLANKVSLPFVKKLSEYVSDF